jgi:hypothetical protein
LMDWMKASSPKATSLIASGGAGRAGRCTDVLLLTLNAHADDKARN